MTRPSEKAPASRRLLALLVVVVAVGVVVSLLVAERIGVNGGEGWDGRAYAAWARDFPRAVFTHQLTGYQAQRVLPSGGLYAALGLLGIDRSPQHVILGFRVLDGLELVLSAIVLARIASTLRWSRQATCGAFIATFTSFAIAKHALYNPVMTDVSAFFLGMVIVLGFVERRPVVLAAVALASALTWPALLYLAIVALALPNPNQRYGAAVRERTRAAIPTAIATAGIVLAWLVEEIVRPFEGTEHMLELSHRALWPVTIAAITGLATAAAYMVANVARTWSVGAYLQLVGVRRVAVGAAFGIAVLIARASWVHAVYNGEDGMALVGIQHMYAAFALRGPLWAPVHHVVYFGPIVLVAVVAWNRIAERCSVWGPTHTLFLGMLVITAVTPESRQLVHLVPFAIVATISATHAQWSSWIRVLVFGVVSLGWSKLWLVIAYDTAHDPSAWPDLRYTMHHGPWATDGTFLAHGIAAALTAALLVLAWRRTRDRVPIEDGDGSEHALVG